MEVGFARESDSVNPDTLIQQMEDCQNGLNTEYNEKLNEIIADLRTLLRRYLDVRHPGLFVPQPQDGPHFQVMMSSFEEIAFLLLEIRDFDKLEKEYFKVASETRMKIESFDLLDESFFDTFNKDRGMQMALQGKRTALESFRDTHRVMDDARLNLERVYGKLYPRVQKLMDLTNTNAKDGHPATSGTGHGRGRDAFLGILRKGIYASLEGSVYILELGCFRVFRYPWPKLKLEHEERFRMWIDLQMERLDLLEKRERQEIGWDTLKRMWDNLDKSYYRIFGLEEPEQEADVDTGNGCCCFQSVWGFIKMLWTRSPTN